MKKLEKDNFVAFLGGREYDAPRLQSEMQFVIGMALRKNRFPPSTFSDMDDLVGEMFSAMCAKPPNLSGEGWFLEIYRLARRVASRYFRRMKPREEQSSDPQGHVIVDGQPDEAFPEPWSGNIPESFEAYITGLELDADTESVVYSVIDHKMFNTDPDILDLSLRRAVLFAVMM